MEIITFARILTFHERDERKISAIGFPSKIFSASSSQTKVPTDIDFLLCGMVATKNYMW